MAIIPSTAKVLNQYENVNTTYGGSKAMKAQSKWYTMGDVLETVEANIPGGGVTEIIAGDGISVDEGTGVVTITNTVEPYVAPYTVFTALVSQVGDSSSNSLSAGPVQEGVTYRLTGVSIASDFSNVGGPGAGEAVDDTYFIATNNETPLDYGGGALAYDSGAPIVTVLENTIGNIWFEYGNDGRYYISSDDLFTQGRTFINGTSFINYSTFNVLLDLSSFGANLKRGYFFEIPSGVEDQISLYTLKDVATPGNGIIENPICIEIRVYN